MSNRKDLAIQEKPVLPAFSMTPRTFDEALKFAELMSESDLVPSGYKGKPGNILVAIQKGFEVGLTPMAALETIAVINGRASMYGDGLLALVQSHPMYEWINEKESTEKIGVCTIKRKGEEAYTQTFSLEDARRAGLLDKPGPWKQYTKRMLQLRARGFALRDKFADALKGMIAAEEALDIHAEVVTDAVQPQSLKDKLKAQVVDAGEVIDSGTPVKSASAQETEQPAPPEPEPPRSLDADLLKQEYDGRLAAAQNVKDCSVVRDDVSRSDLPLDWKNAFYINWSERMNKLASKKK